MKTKLLALLLILVMAVGMLAACGGGGDTCTKHVDENKDGICDNEGCGARVEIPKCAQCVDANKDGKCDVCKRTVVAAACENHKDLDGDSFCEECGDKWNIWDGVDGFEITNEWDTTNLVFKLTENSNSGELSSQCHRYMAGDDDDFRTETVDREVTKRNNEAYRKANVTVEYKYYDTSKDWGWGGNIEDIKTHCGTKTSLSPDMYCNFVYDMVAASLNGSFANLYSVVMGEGDLYGVNYFQFLQKEGEVEYRDEKANDDTAKGNGKDYMFEYMKSLTLSKKKMYCLSSDYFTDMVRAFFVVPVNINLINSIPVSTTGDPNAFNADRVGGDNDFTIDDFYKLVWDGQWNYETLAQFSQAVSTNASGKEDLNDTVGFAVSQSSGLSASGLVYTTPVVVINRVWDDTLDDGMGGKGDYKYFYPDPKTDEGDKQIKELVSLCDNMSVLFQKPGVICVSDADASELGIDGSLEAIRQKFKSGNVLFGGVVCLGSLEDQVYQDMKADGGFGVVPVPLFRSTNPDTGNPDRYLTQIHNIGRVGAIAKNTYYFAQCTAFLDYVSTHSSGILNEYYNFKLKYDVAGGVNGNAKMLEYIRTNVRSSFDKAFEDAIGKFFEVKDPQSNENKWHEMIRIANYELNDMYNKYKGLYEIKEEYLTGVYNSYPNFPE